MAGANPSGEPANKSLLAPLQHIDLARKGAGSYYPTLAKTSDEIVRFGAYCQMLSVKALPREHYEVAVALCKHPAIKERAFDFFESSLLPDWAKRVADTPTDNPDTVRTQLMQSDLKFDFAGMARGHAALYLVTGDLRHLRKAALAEEHLAGWRGAAEWLVRAIAIMPIDPINVAELYRVLTEANQFATIDELNRVLGRAGLHPFIAGVYAANVLLSRGEADGCIAKLKSLSMPTATAPAATRPVHAHALRLAAEAQERLGNYQASYRNYVEMNRLEATPSIDGKSVYRGMLKDIEASLTQLQPSGRTDVVMLLGFARSATTLLESILDSHPLIETLEETPTWDTAMADIRLGRKSTGVGNADTHARRSAHARDVYFAEVGRRRRKTGATHVIDKYPMRSMYSAPLSWIIPDQKYLFSIRHPFDVVLSCFRQRFAANVGMENFRTVKDTVEFYDFAMSQWFAIHSLNDPFVHYVRYDSLIRDFGPTVGAALDFIGVPWDEAVREFAQGATLKSALTPSYQKIRKGLSIGVQSSWRNYGFLFSTPEAKPLFKWAEFFGYETH